MLTVNGLVGIMAQPHQLAAVGTGKDERTCRVGMFYGNMIKRMHGGLGAGRPDRRRYGRAGTCRRGIARRCRERLRLRVPPAALSRALGLMIASILAANMSTLGVPGRQRRVVHRRPLRRRIRPNRVDRHYLWVGRASGFVITMLGVLLDLPDRERPLHLPAHGNAGDLRRDRGARRNPVAASEPLGALASLIASLATNLRPLRGHGRAARLLGSERFPRLARHWRHRAGRGQSAHAAGATGSNR